MGGAVFVNGGTLTAGNVTFANNQAQGGNGGYTLKFYGNAASHYMLSGNTVWLEPNTTKAPTIPKSCMATIRQA